MKVDPGMAVVSIQPEGSRGLVGHWPARRSGIRDWRSVGKERPRRRLRRAEDMSTAGRVRLQLQLGAVPDRRMSVSAGSARGEEGEAHI